jgi:hypothetical protein
MIMPFVIPISVTAPRLQPFLLIFSQSSHYVGIVSLSSC